MRLTQAKRIERITLRRMLVELQVEHWSRSARGRGFNSRHHANDVAQQNAFHPPLLPGPKDKHLGRCRWNYITDKVAGSNPAIALASPERCSSAWKSVSPNVSSIPCCQDHTTLGECQRNYIAQPWDHPRGSTPLIAVAQTENHPRVGAGPQTVSLPLSPRQTYPANAGGTTSGRGFEPRPIFWVAQLVEQNLRVSQPLLPDPISSPGECWLELHS